MIQPAAKTIAGQFFKSVEKLTTT